MAVGRARPPMEDLTLHLIWGERIRKKGVGTEMERPE